MQLPSVPGGGKGGVCQHQKGVYQNRGEVNVDPFPRYMYDMIRVIEKYGKSNGKIF